MFLKVIVRAALAAFALSSVVAHAAIDVAGVKVEEKMRIGTTDTVLNGSGIRYAAAGLVRVYVASLYLPQKRATSAEIVALKGPRRVQLNMLRDITNDDFAKGLMTGVRNNLSSSDRVGHFESLSKLGEIFGKIPGLKKGDVVWMDTIPGTGTVISVNGKRVGDVFPDETFWNSLFQIWVGPKPIDSSLKP
ncbi:MAG: chalcone isomerase family protein, partial [Casimicrobium sp.]